MVFLWIFPWIFSGVQRLTMLQFKALLPNSLYQRIYQTGAQKIKTIRKVFSCSYF